MSRGNPGSRFEVITDLSTLPSIAEDTILATLRERYLSDHPYTSLGTSGLISLNPHKHLKLNDDEALRRYVDDYRDVKVDEDGGRGEGYGRETEGLGPHVFGLTVGAYYHMRRTGQDQTILISGETGSGKSAMRRLSLKAIIELSLSNPGKKGSKLGGQIPSAEYILESFGSARTHQNENASRFGKYTELQFSSRGRLAGSKTLAYYLEKSRVASPSPGERNFHVFYYLVAGASQEERNHLMLGNSAQYRYLGNRFAGGGREEEDEMRWEQLQAAFKAVGLSKRHVAQVCQLIAAILHLGNIDFIYDKSRNEDAAVVRNAETLQLVADFLGVRPEALEAVFSYRSKMLKKELVTAFLDTEGAAANRDELANTLYSLLFTWLTEHLNTKLCKDDFTSFIGLLDFPGFQNLAGVTSRVNSLDQFVVNYANEKMQNWILQKVFNGETAEMDQEGLSGFSPPVAFFDNSECLRLLDNQPGGLIHITDDQARRTPKKTEHTMIEAYSKRWGSHASFKLSGMDRTGFPTFTVSHFTGPVTYSTESFLEKDADVINPDFVSLLRGSHVEEKQGSKRAPGPAIPHGTESPGSSNPFIKGLFSNRTVATEVHPHDEETIVAAQQSVKPMRAPSMRRKGRNARLASVGEEREEGGEVVEGAEVGGGNNEAPARGVKCILGEFKSSMDTLYQALDDTQAWYIFCLNPNDAHLPNQVETRGLRGQIRSFGLPEFAKKLKHVYEVSMTHQEVCERYAEEFNAFGIPHGGSTPAVEAVKKLAAQKGWNENDVLVGKFKLFLSHKAFHSLEDRLRIDDEDGDRERERPTTMNFLSAGQHRSDEGGLYASKAAAVSSPGFDKYDGQYQDNGSQAVLPLVGRNQGYEAAASEADDYYDDRKTPEYEFDKKSRGYADAASFVGTEAYAPSKNMFSSIDRKDDGETEKDPLNAPHTGETAEEIKESSSRRRWRFLCMLLTWWCPNFLLSWVGRLKRPDIRQAWREKLAINLIIWFICGCTIFVIAILGNLICPREYVYSTGELADHNYEDQPNNAYTAIRGEVFDLSGFAPSHLTTVGVVPTKNVMKYAGIDATSLFPVQVSALCDGVDGNVSPWVTLDSTNSSDVNAQYHDFRASTNDSRPDWYFEQMVVMRWNYRVGFVGYTPKEIKSMAKSGRAIAIVDGLVYELSTYIAQGGGGLRAPTGYQVPGDVNRQFMSPAIISVFQQNAGKDVTKLLDDLVGTIGADTVNRQKTCLRNLFLIGKTDNRNSAQCQFSSYILLALSVLMVAIIGFKFLAALHFGSSRAPEDHDKFIICQIPCYTESEDSLRRTIDSLARLRYDDKRKLMVIICDGNIVGAGNDRPTPRIVLDIVGADPTLEPEPLSFLSLGDGAKQHNMGKVYSGLYEVAGHVVPYLVIVKVGKPSERQRPGNRGKRDSQMVVMHFLNKVHFDAPMNPLELEMYHQIKNVIGVNPTFYEYIFTVDADTTVEELALNRLVSAMVHDKRIIASCGETELANPKQSLITMMQVYEYFISHHLTKSFESLFGSITCLPGCFSIYRLRAPDTHKPLFVSNQIIHDYSENRVDTLHMKNLLHLGEDRYLTTLILKHFPGHKTKFVRDAHAYTVAPDDFKVLLSQRRRWINSTIHNLVELTTIEGLCGFCGFFGMRAIVFIDLLSTIISPVTVAYIGYLLYLVIKEGKTIPTLSIVMLAAIYGLQALIFIFRLRWDMIAWMFFYIIAIPAFSFFLPLYSFWHMDVFVWGNTRVVLGESGKKVVIHDEGKFDPRSIPEKSWREYENELWDNDNDNHSLSSWVPEKQPLADSRAPSFYGHRTEYAESAREFQSRSPSGYDQYRASRYDAMDHQGSNGGTPLMQSHQLPQVGNVPFDQGSIYGGYPQSDHHGSTNFIQPRQSMASRPTSRFIPETNPSAPLHMGGADITDAELEGAIRRICLAEGTDLESLTKKSVRRDLERLYQTDLSARKQTINALIEKVLTGQ